jgi:ubiquinone/menaquinone biosynthesis C-methylase UbiE
MADPKSIDPPTTSVDERESEKTPLAAGDVAISHFNWAAPTYEDTSGGASRELALRIVELIPKPIHCFAVVLDNACGTGQVAQELLKYMRSEYERDRCNTRIPDGGIFCVDGAERMIDIARTQTQEVIRQLRSHVRSDFINVSRQGPALPYDTPY